MVRQLDLFAGGGGRTPGRAKISVNCKTCGKSFERFLSHVNNPRLKSGPFCSRSCASLSLRQGAKNGNYKGGPVSLMCVACGVQFNVRPGAATSSKYCSAECRGKMQKGHVRQLPDHTCAACGALFRPSRRTARYCSDVCRQAGHGGVIKLSRSGLYVRASSAEPYPAGWSKRVTTFIRDRDGNVCRLCGVSENGNGRKLHVHHIDFDRSNLSQENLITLCYRCHGKCHGGSKNRAERRLKLETLIAEILNVSSPT